MPDGSDGDMGPGALSFIPRAPSGFHNEAWLRSRREPKHDVIQQELLAFLRRRPVVGLPAGVAVSRHVEGEFPLKRRDGQIVGYADAVEILDINLTCFVSLFEVKPRLDSIFPVLRQAKAMLALARLAVPRADQAYCHIVVPATDPQLPNLRMEWPHTWAWGFEPVFPEGQ